MTRFAALALLALAACVAAPADSAESAPAASAGGPREILVVKMHADWCTKCRLMDDAYREAKATLEAEGIEVWEMDFTSAATTDGAMAEAAARGLAEVVAPHKGSTGFLLLVDTAVPESVGVVHHTESAAGMVAAVRAAAG